MYFPNHVWSNICSYLLVDDLYERRCQIFGDFKTLFCALYKNMTIKFVTSERDGYKIDELLYEWAYSNTMYTHMNKRFVYLNSKYLNVKSLVMSTHPSCKDRGHFFTSVERYIRACERILSVLSGAHVIRETYYTWYIPTLERLLNVENMIANSARYNLYKKAMFNMFLNRRFMYFSEPNLFTDYDVSGVHINLKAMIKKRPLRIQRIFQGFNTIPSSFAMNHIASTSDYLEDYDNSDYHLEKYLRSNFFIPITEEEYSLILNTEDTSTPDNSGSYTFSQLLVCDDIFQTDIDPNELRNFQIERRHIYST